MLDPKWLDALSLPAKVTGGLCAFFALALAMDSYFTPLLGSWRPMFILGALFTGCLFGATMIAAAKEAIVERGKPAKLAKRRQLVREDQARERAEAKAERESIIRKRIETLSDDEVRHVAKALRAGSPSFKSWANDGDLSNLMHRGLLTSPGGTHHQDYYPFSFPDDVWAILVENRDAILAKDDEIEQRRAARGRR